MSVCSRHKTSQPWTAKTAQYRDISPGRTKVWIEPDVKIMEQKVPVVYYLSRNGVLEQPHFIEVPLSSSQGLFLKDVIIRLNRLRGQGLANMYSWSSKRSYKTGYVWQDLSENDIVNPCNNDEYILKGSQLQEPLITFSSSSSSTAATNNSKTLTLIEPANSRSISIYRAKTTGGGLAGRAANAATQTVDCGGGEVEEEAVCGEREEIEISPVVSNSSSTEGRVSLDVGTEYYTPGDIRDRTVENERPSGRMKASTVLMQLIACGAKKDGDDQSTCVGKD